MATHDEIIIEAIAHEKGVKELNDKLYILEQFAQKGAKGKLTPKLRLDFEKELKEVGRLSKALSFELPKAFKQAVDGAKATSTASSGAMEMFANDAVRATDKAKGALLNMGTAIDKYRKDIDGKYKLDGAAYRALTARDMDKLEAEARDRFKKQSTYYTRLELEFRKGQDNMVRSYRAALGAMDNDFDRSANRRAAKLKEAYNKTAAYSYGGEQSVANYRTPTQADRYRYINAPVNLRANYIKDSKSSVNAESLNQTKQVLDNLEKTADMLDKLAAGQNLNMRITPNSLEGLETFESKLKAVEQDGRKVNVNMKLTGEEDLHRLDRELKDIPPETDVKVKLDVINSKAISNITSDARVELGHFRRNIDDLASHSNRIFSSILTGITTGITSRLPSITEIAKGAVKDIGDLQYSMMGIGGQIAPKEGTDKAVQIQNQMLAYQRKSVQSNVMLSESMAYLLESNNADTSMKMIKQIDNIVSMTGGDIKNTAKAISQAQGMHTLRGQEINQLVNSQASVIVSQVRKDVENAARTGALGETAEERASNKSIQEAADRGEGASIFDLKRQEPKKYGTIEIKYLNQAIEELGGSTGTFAKGVDIAAATLKGSIQNTKESITQAGAQALGYYIDPKTGIGKFTEGSVLYVATENITKIQSKITDMLYDKDGKIKQSVVDFSKQMGTNLQKAIDYLSGLDWQSIWVKAKDVFSNFYEDGKQLAQDFDLKGSLGAMTTFAKVAHPVIFGFLDMLSKNAGSITTFFLLNKAFTTIAGPMKTFINLAKGLKGLTSLGGAEGVVEGVEGAGGGALGSLGGLFGKIGGAVAGGELAIAGAAGDIYLMSNALKEMHKNLKDIDGDALAADFLNLAGVTLAIEGFVGLTGMAAASNPFVLLGEVVGTIVLGLADLDVSIMDDTFKKLRSIQTNLTELSDFKMTNDVTTGITNTKNAINDLHKAVSGGENGESLSKLSNEIYNDFLGGNTPLTVTVQGITRGIDDLKDFSDAVDKFITDSANIKVDAIKGSMNTIKSALSALNASISDNEQALFNNSQDLNTSLNTKQGVNAYTYGMYNFNDGLSPKGGQKNPKSGGIQFQGTLLTSLKASADNATKLYEDGVKPYVEALKNLANAKGDIEKNTATASAMFTTLANSLTELNTAIMNGDEAKRSGMLPSDQPNATSAATSLADNLNTLNRSMQDIVISVENLAEGLKKVSGTFETSGHFIATAFMNGMKSVLTTKSFNDAVSSMVNDADTEQPKAIGVRIGNALFNGIISSLNIASIQSSLNSLKAPNLSAKVEYSSNVPNTTNTANTRQSGFLAGFAQGGSIGTDNIPALLSAGEYVMRKSASEFWGKSLLSRINNLDISGAYQTLASKIGIGGFGTSGNVHNSSYDNSRKTTNVNVINRNHGRMGRSEMLRLTGGL